MGCYNKNSVKCTEAKTFMGQEFNSFLNTVYKLLKI